MSRAVIASKAEPAFVKQPRHQTNDEMKGVVNND